MIAHNLAWIIAAVCAFIAAAVFVWQRRATALALERAQQAERKLALLGRIAPALTEAATESMPLTCERVVERFNALVRAQTVLCLIARDGRLVLGAKSDSGYAGFLRIGDSCDGDSILDWVEQTGRAAIVGPTEVHLYPDSDVADLSRDPRGLRLGGPLVGSRDRVWALCVPMLQQRGHQLRPTFIGALYAERSHDDPFTREELWTATTIAHLAGDALQRAHFADEVKRESEIDQLTQLLSASAFRKRLRQEIEARRPLAATHIAADHVAADLQVRSNERPDVALFFIDTDRFKLWNDSFGHVVGDLLLKRLADIFREVSATGGFAGRNGGDEFCIALLDRTKDNAIEVAERLRERVERTDLGASPEGVPSPRIPVTISIGVAHFPVDVSATADAPADLLLEAADARMYEAKRAGRNRVAYSRTRALPIKIRYPGEGPIPRR